MSQQHPFDDPFAADPGPATYVPSAGHDYSRSVVSHTGRSFRPGFRATSGLNAPLLLWAASACYMLELCYILWLVYRVYEESHRINSIAGALLFLLIAGVTTLVVGMMKAQLWGRWGLVAVTIVGILVMVVPDLWPITLLGIGGAILAWLPSNKYWFGYR